MFEVPTINTEKGTDNEAEKKIENETGKEKGGRFLKKLSKSIIGKTLMGLGAAMAVYGTAEANAQGYDINPKTQRDRLLRISQDPEKKAIYTKQFSAESIKDCKITQGPEGNFTCELILQQNQQDAQEEKLKRLTIRWSEIESSNKQNN